MQQTGTKHINQDLIQVKKTKFVEMYWNEENRELTMITNGDTYKITHIPLNKIPQIIRGLFSAYQRFDGKKKRR